MYKVKNISGQVIGLVHNEDGKIRQTNLFPGKSLEVRSCEGQIYNLCDPSKNLLKVEEVK